MNPNASFGAGVFANCSNVTIHGWNPSTAKTYAEDNSINFVSLGDLSGQCGENVSYVFDPVTGKLTISGTGEMTHFNSNAGVPWGSFRENITSVVIEDGVTYISYCAFYDCENLTSVTIPNSVTDIATSAFNCCVSLESVVIPENVIILFAF